MKKQTKFKDTFLYILTLKEIDNSEYQKSKIIKTNHINNYWQDITAAYSKLATVSRPQLYV
jgi:hypothetical protein